jgi:glucose dehydrogenase
MIDNVLYLSTPYNRVVALDADTGKQVWSFDPEAQPGDLLREAPGPRAANRNLGGLVSEP